MPELLVFTNQNILALLQQDPAKRGTGERVDSHARLLPTGYEDFLRALGHELDQRKAEAITITEFEGMVAVGSAAIIAHDGAIGLAPFQDFWRPDDIEQLLNRAFRRRGWSQQS